jgi:hypothetical protein
MHQVLHTNHGSFNARRPGAVVADVRTWNGTITHWARRRGRGYLLSTLVLVMATLVLVSQATRL